MEKALLVGLHLKGTKKTNTQNSMLELTRLAQTAGATPEEIIIQSRTKIDPAFLIGSGKAKELKDIAKNKNIHTVIFDEDLKPIQQKNLEEIIETKIIDRTRLILDIFAKRARSKEGILQVERAQLEYFLPRLTKKGVMLDSQLGGIGIRGPGEKKLEVDQRRIRDRMSFLDKEIKEIRRHRKVLYQKRTESKQAVVAIVGYTNSGKSTLLNALNKKNEIYADDRLFATLDPITRRVQLPNGRIVLFTDTVGFINKLPHTLIDAFRATLEEITRANCLLHLIDVSNPDYKQQIKTVINVLKELNAGHIPVISVYNKSDLLGKKQKNKLLDSNHFFISAKTREGLDELLLRIQKIITPKHNLHGLILPYNKNHLLSEIFKLAVVRNQSYTDSGIKINIETTAEHWEMIKERLKK